MFIDGELNKNLNIRHIFLLAGILIIAFFAYREIESSKKEAILLEELKSQNEAVSTLSDEIARLKIQVETLIDEAQNKTREEINAKIAVLEKNLLEEEGRRQDLESKFKSEAGLSLARIQDLEETTSKEDTLSKIISEWRVRTAHVKCTFVNGQGIGSGVFVKFIESGKEIYGVLTNRHVLLDSTGRPATSCSLTFPDFNKQVIGTSQGRNIEISTNGFDFGRIVIPSPDAELRFLSANETHFCKGNPSFGDELVILGYPYIGSGKDITATDGIVSGFEDNFYITSAKVEQGNSGGTAILVKENCLLGIPTYVQLGSLESLARILKIDVLYK